MKSIFLSLVYSFIRLIGLTLLIGCGSVQSINGVKYRDPATKQNVKVYTWVCVGAVGFLVWGMYNEKAIE